MASARCALLFAAAFLAVSAGSAARPMHPAMPPVAVVVLVPAAAPYVGGVQDVLMARALTVPGAGAVLAPATPSLDGSAQEALMQRALAVPIAGVVLAPAAAPLVGGAQEALVVLEVPSAGVVLAPATASRVGGAQEALVARELPVAGAGAVLTPATASRNGGAQQALVMWELSVSVAGAVAKKHPPPLAVVCDERRRASSVVSVTVGRALGSTAPVLPSPNSFSPSDGEHAPDDLALHRTMAARDGARAPLAPGIIVGIVCAVVAAVAGALAVAVCCYCARKRRAAAREQVLGWPASPRWVSPNDLVQV